VVHLVFGWVWPSLGQAGEDKVRFLGREDSTHLTGTALLVEGGLLLSAALLTPPIFALVSHRYPIGQKPIRFGRVAGYVLGNRALHHRLREPPLDFSAAPGNVSCSDVRNNASLHALAYGFWTFFAEDNLELHHCSGSRRMPYEYFKRARGPGKFQLQAGRLPPASSKP